MVPEFLKNRPRNFVNHCLRRLSTAEEISQNDIISLDPVAGLFRVKSHLSSEWYSVSFGDSNKMPTCSCQDWQSSFMPCKHFLAVMKLHPEWSWHRLPSQYLDSPFFNTDNDVCSKEFHLPVKNTLCETAEVHQMSEAAIEVVHPLQNSSFRKRSKAAACREVLGQLKSLTYLVDDDEALAELLAGQIDLKEDLQSHAPQEDGIDLEKRSRKPFHTSAQTACKIPVRRSNKNMSGRVGIGATRKRKVKSLKVLSEKDEVETDVVETHDLLQMYELPDCFNDYLPKYDSDLGGNELNETTLNGIDIKSQNLVDNKTFLKVSSNFQKIESKGARHEITRECNSDDDIIETNYIPPHKTVEPKWRVNLKYSTLERQEILNGHMLTDMTINYAQKILMRNFPTISGLEDTTVGAVLNFSKHDGKSPYIQVLHTGSLHWICISNISVNGLVKADVVNLYDSLNSRGTINTHIRDQIADFLFLPSAPEIHVDVQPVQQQTNGTNCGVFAIAYAVDLANNQDPKKIRYNESRMRQHLHDCLQAERLIPFPQEDGYHCRVQRKITRKNIDLFCVCRRPYQKGTLTMKCGICRESFHKECMDIPEVIFEQRCFWCCKSCNNSQFI